MPVGGVARLTAYWMWQSVMLESFGGRCTAFRPGRWIMTRSIHSASASVPSPRW